MRAQNSDRSIVLLLDYPRAAEALAMTEQALRDLVWKNKGPVVTEIGRRRKFAVSDLEAFVASHRKPPAPPNASSEAFPRQRRGRLPRNNKNKPSATTKVRAKRPDDGKD